MNTLLTDRLFSDPRLKHLSRELGCPLKALGTLGWMWHGTQNVGVSVADECLILDTLPLGVRKPENLVRALEVSGWIEKCEDGFRIIGNDEHIKAREKIKEGGKKGAAAKWAKKDGHPITPPISENMADPENVDGSKMVISTTSPPLTSTTSTGEGERAPLEDDNGEVDRFTLTMASGVWVEAQRSKLGVKNPVALRGARDARHLRTIIHACPNDWQAFMAWYVGCGDKYADQEGYPFAILATQAGRLLTKWQRTPVDDRPGARVVESYEEGLAREAEQKRWAEEAATPENEMKAAEFFSKLRERGMIKP